jgi:hypothetical protein
MNHPVEASVCPAHRPFVARNGDFLRYDDFISYLRDEIGAKGILLKAFDRHVRTLGNEEGFYLKDLAKSFVQDEVFSGVTRAASREHVLKAIYAAVDPDRPAGERQLAYHDLPAFASIMREAFPAEPIFGNDKGVVAGLKARLGREWKITQTVGEWSLLIRAAADHGDQSFAVQEGVHAALVNGVWFGKKRDVGAAHIFPGIVGVVASNFRSTNAAEKAAASEIRAAAKDVFAG